MAGVIGMSGKDSVGAQIEKTSDKVIYGTKVEIQAFQGLLEFWRQRTPGRRHEDLVLKQARKLAELRSCHVLFISSSEKNHVPSILKPLKDASVLTVSETETFAREGGIINFLDGGNRVQIEINLDAAEQARLKISSKLLSLARIVRADRPGGEK